MDKLPRSPNTPWWAARVLRKPEPAPPDTDYADMGTAFGLDASMKTAPDVAPPATGDAGPATDRLNRRSVL